MTTTQATHTTEYTSKAAAQAAADRTTNVTDLYRQGASWYVVAAAQ